MIITQGQIKMTTHLILPIDPLPLKGAAPNYSPAQTVQVKSHGRIKQDDRRRLSLCTEYPQVPANFIKYS